MPFYEEPQIPEALELRDPEGQRLLAAHAPRPHRGGQPAPGDLPVGRGATSIIDMPEEMLDFFGSMINMDNPRHARLRRIVRLLDPRMIKSIEDRSSWEPTSDRPGGGPGPL